MSNQLSDLGFHARLYALAGIKVFPVHGIVDTPDGRRCACRDGHNCKSPGKHPVFRPAHDKEWTLANGKCYGRCGQLGHGLYDATDDVDTIVRWWTDNPRANIGQPAHGNGYAILDVDPKSGGDDSFAKLHAYVLDRTGVDLMETLVQRTGSGGMHLLYAAPEAGIKSGSKVFGADMPGLDTRGVGGYTVTWPSVHISGGEYEYIDWLREAHPWPPVLTVLMNPPKVQATQVRQRGTSPKYGESALDKELDILLSAPEGTRNDQLNRSSFNIGTLVGGGFLTEGVARGELIRAALAIGLGMTETLKTVESGLRDGIANPRRLVGVA